MGVVMGGGAWHQDRLGHIELEVNNFTPRAK